MEKGGRVVRSVERLAALEGLRGLAAFYVVLSHIVTMVEGVHGRRNLPDYLQILFEPFRYGHLAVAAFIVLSGFCLQFAMFEHSDGLLKKVSWFYKRRARRILPPYYACLALSLVVALYITPQEGEPFNQYLPVTLENVLAHIFLVHNAQVEWMYKINGVLWSIAIEVQLYLLMPLFNRVLFKFGRFSLLAGVGALVLPLMFMVPNGGKLYAWFIFLFCAGMVAAHFAFRPSLAVGPRPAVGWALGVVWMAIAALLSTFNQPIWAGDLAIGIATGCICYALVLEPHRSFSRFSGNRYVAGMGLFSYSLYLIHHPIMQTLFVFKPSIVNSPVNLTVYLVGMLPVILLGSYGFFRLFEAPFMNPRAKHSVPPREWTVQSLPLVSAGPGVDAEIWADRIKGNAESGLPRLL